MLQLFWLMRTVLTRFFPFSQDQTPIWNEFWSDGNTGLEAKCWEAIARHSPGGIREQKLVSQPFRTHIVHLFGEIKALRVMSTELPPWCAAFRDRTAFCSWPPLLLLLQTLCCRIICSRWEVNTLCFLFFSTFVLPGAAIYPHLHFFCFPPSSRSQLTTFCMEI